MAKIRFHREGIDPGAKGVRAWIERWSEDSSDLRIREITIRCPEDIAKLSDTAPFRQASQRNETALHSYLKFVGWHWLSSTVGVRAKPQYETRMYLPTPGALDGVTIVDSAFDPSKPFLLTRRRRDVFAQYGNIISVDVYCAKHSIEVGFTQPFNLCMPLLAGLVKKAIWIPYPRGVTLEQLVPTTLKTVNAYEVECEDN